MNGCQLIKREAVGPYIPRKLVQANILTVVTHYAIMAVSHWDGCYATWFIVNKHITRIRVNVKDTRARPRGGDDMDRVLVFGMSR